MSDLYNALQYAFAPEDRPRPAVSSETLERPKGEFCILVVDDNEVNQFVAVEQVEQMGYRAEVASNGLQAFEKIKKGNYTVVLMDCQMPVMDGYTATKEVREWEEPLGKHTTIIALTAHALAGERDRVLAAGMDDYLSKPVRPDALERMLRHYRVVADGAGEPRHIDSSAPPSLDSGTRRSPKLIQLFLRNMPGQLSQLTQAIEDGDFAAARAHAHKLKGSCLAIGALAMADLAEAVQRGCESGERPSVADLERAAARVVRDLRQELPVNVSAAS
jgi:CheY-like chemotaxis protein